MFLRLPSTVLFDGTLHVRRQLLLTRVNTVLQSQGTSVHQESGACGQNTRWLAHSSRGKSMLPRLHGGFALRRAQGGRAFVHGIVRAWAVTATGVVQHRGFMVGAPDTDRRRWSDDLVAFGIEFAYPTSDGSQRPFEQGHFHRAVVTLLCVVLNHFEKGIRTQCQEPAVCGGDVQFSTSLRLQGLPN